MINNKSRGLFTVLKLFLCTPTVLSVNNIFQVNIALNKHATQSGNLTYPGTGDVWSASNAVDGNKDCTNADKDHFSGTAYKQVPWWQVDLENIYSLSTIIVYGQSKDISVQLKGFVVYLSISANGTDKQKVYTNNLYEKGGVFKIALQSNIFGRYVRIEMPGTYRDPPGRDGTLVLCEVEAYSTDIIQELKSTLVTYMSPRETYNEPHIHWDKDRAIDNVREFNPDTCGCCSGTSGREIPWWKLELPKPNLIAQLMIYGRSDSGHTDQSDNLFIYGSNSTSENGTQLFHGNPNSANAVYSISLQPPRLFQVLTVRRWIAGSMTICEVKIFPAGCPVGSFGDKCLGRCNCKNGVTCDVNNGHCDSCPPGFSGDSCQTPCPHSTYGYNCNETCDTCTQMDCRNTDGLCTIGCVPGYKPDNNICKEACDDGYYGQNCSEYCSGHCKNGNHQCNKINGTCMQGCVDGYVGERCEKECAPSRYGENCSQICNTCEDMLCNNTDGLCFNGCFPGYKPDDPYCKKECDHSSYGKNCSQICSTCENMSCNNTNGWCYNGCVPGYKSDDPYCKKDCIGGTFGRNCNSSCHCANNDECSKVNGTCFDNRCAPEWKGPSCQVLELSESSQSHSGAIGGGVGATVAVIITAVIIGYIIHRRRNVNKSSDRESQFTNLDKALDSRKQTLVKRHESSMTASVNRSSEGEEETAVTQSDTGDYYSFGENFGGIRIYELWDCIKDKMENECEKFYSEFKTLPSGLVHPSKSADKLVNKGKNRYKEMYAYDHTRVVLDVEESTYTDYINACYIDGYDKTKKFVASQGPTKQMIDDFWRMVWQLKSDKIVMLTNLIEMGTTKCLQYWPLEDEEDEHRFGKVIVRVLKTESFLDYNIRLFEVRKNGESSRKIRQYHFKSWPDKDVPDSTWCLVNFWRAVNTNEPSTAGPIVVHCSAGVGRTGTFIALDNLVSQAKAEGCVRPLQVVETLRRQRVNMVQTKEQYVYLHEAVADALLFGTHYVFTKQFGEMFSFMSQKVKGETKSNLEKQFELIEKSTRDTTSAGAAENVEYTNVETIQSESAAYRPKLKNRGSKFVQELGAMYIPNYEGKNTFLISMSPDKNTMEEFWSLVDDSHIKTIIMLTETSASCYQASCHLGANPKNGSKFSVNKIEEKIRKGFTERTFSFKESNREEEEYLTTVKQFEYTDWKDGSAVLGETKQMLEMINSIQKWQPHLSESQPILVHCSDGCKRSGIICVLLSELQRIQYEGGLINILESVKMMKKRQKFLIPTYEQYRFCFDLILAHSKTTEVYANL